MALRYGSLARHKKFYDHPFDSAANMEIDGQTNVTVVRGLEVSGLVIGLQDGKALSYVNWFTVGI